MRPHLRSIYDDVMALAEPGADVLAETADAYESALDGNHRIVDTAQLAMLRGGSDLDALEAVLRAHPDAITKINQISQYRTHVRKAGIPLDSNTKVKQRQARERLEGARA